MNLTRREFIEVMVAAGAAGMIGTGCASNGRTTRWQPMPRDFYDVPTYGNVSFLHYTDCHAQLNPVYFREPNVNIGVGEMQGKPPVLVGDKLLEHFNIPHGTPQAHAITHLDFVDAAHKYGRVGGFAHLSTLVKKLRAERPNSLLLDGGDTWQGSATSLWTDAQDMVDAQKLLGIDVAIGHWEFTYGEERVLDIIKNHFEPNGIDWVAQNIVDTDWGDPVFKPYTMREMNGIPVAVVGQAFPFTTVANPRYKIPNWSFGIRDENLQQVVDQARGEGAQAVVVLSHNGMATDIKMASRVNGIDAIMGGHTHDAMPGAIEVESPDGSKTLVTNAGSNGKFISVLDFDVRRGKVQGYQYKLLPVFSNYLEPDAEMAAHIDAVRAPYKEKLAEELAVTDDVLYRRGNFNGTFDEVIVQAMMKEMDAEAALSPGFRWGVSVLPGQPITFDDLMTQTATTYSETTRSEMSGAQIMNALEDVANSIFNDDPYRHRGGDMVRTGGMEYTIDPHKSMGERITDLEINGQRVDPDKTYVVAGWASVAQPLDSEPVWDVVARHLRSEGTVSVGEPYLPKLKNVRRDPGLDV